MGLLEALIYLSVGLLVLLWGGDWLVRAAADLAARFKISPSVIGLTIVAAGTSAPELLTSLMAAFDGASNVAMGNIIGSNTFNLLLVLGISACVFPIFLLSTSSSGATCDAASAGAVGASSVGAGSVGACSVGACSVEAGGLRVATAKREEDSHHPTPYSSAQQLKKTRLHQQYFALVGVSLLFVALLYNHILGRIEGVILVLVLLVLAYAAFKTAQSGWGEVPSHLGQVNRFFAKIFRFVGWAEVPPVGARILASQTEEQGRVATADRVQKSSVSVEIGSTVAWAPRHFAVQNITMLVVGFVGLVVGARLAISGGVSVGELLGLSQRQIGLFIVSVGTSLPEIAASLMAARQKQNEIAVTNVIGSNILNMLAVGGVTAVLRPLQVEPSLLRVDAMFMLGMTLMLAPLVMLGGYKITRPAACILLGFYVLYTLLVLV